MTTAPIKKVIVFPPLETEQANQVEKLLETMGAYMGVSFGKTEVRVLQVEFDADRTDVAQILSKIAAAKKKK